MNIATASATPLDTTAHLAPWILYLPAGLSTIRASLDGKPAEIQVNVTAATAAVLQKDLVARRAGTVMPFIDFDHEAKRASGWPTEFKWEEGRGVMLCAGWTPGGREAVLAKEYNYFSPEFSFDPKNKAVLGLVPGRPIGGLVNDPAFRSIGALRAAAAALSTPLPDDLADQKKETHPTPTPMNPSLLKAIVTAGILTEAESTADNAAELLATRLAELQKPAAAEASDAASELQALKAKCAARDKADAVRAVTAAVTAGRILPADTATQAWWTETITRDGQPAVQAMNALAVIPVPPDSGLPASERPAAIQAAATAELTETQAAAVAARAAILRKENGYSQQQAWAAAEAEIRAAVR